MLQGLQKLVFFVMVNGNESTYETGSMNNVSGDAFRPVKPEYFNLRANDFLFGLQETSSGIEDVVLLQGSFQETAYSDDLFQECNVDFPTKLTKAVDVRRADFLAGRMLLKCAQNRLGLANQQIKIGPHRAPVWPDDCRGSVTHSHGRVACLLTASVNSHLGIDLEKIASENALKALRQQVLNDAERTLVSSAKDWQPDVLATLVFSAKETLFKALYPKVQSYFGFDAANIYASPSQGKLLLKLTHTLGADCIADQIYEMQYILYPDYVLTWLSIPD